MARYSGPTVEALRRVQEDFPIPANYKGASDSEDLAHLVVDAVNNRGLDFGVVAKSTTVDKSVDDVEAFIILAEKFNIRNPRPIGAAISMFRPLGLPSTMFYALRLAAKFEDSSVGTANSLKRMYALDGVGLDERGFITPLTVEKFHVLYQALRREGIVLPFEDIFKYSTYWVTDELVSLMYEGVDLKMSMNLRETGIDSVEEIIDMQNNMPASWLKELFAEPVPAEEE